MKAYNAFNITICSRPISFPITFAYTYNIYHIMWIQFDLMMVLCRSPIPQNENKMQKTSKEHKADENANEKVVMKCRDRYKWFNSLYIFFVLTLSYEFEWLDVYLKNPSKWI